MGLTQGLLATLVADTAPPVLRGSAFGVFHFTGGVTALLASMVAGDCPNFRVNENGTVPLDARTDSVDTKIRTGPVAGALWQRWGAPFTFMVGAGFSVLALAGLLWWRTRYADAPPAC